ncbi:MAG: phosphosulfolactate synthase [bacterium]
MYFLELLGCNVNLGNIATDDVLALESLRWGLRWETVTRQSPLTKIKSIET